VGEAWTVRRNVPFLGQLMGIALRNNISLPLHLGPLVWRPLVGEPVRPSDLRSVDKDTYERLERIGAIGRRHAKAPEKETREDLEMLEDVNWTTYLSDGTEVELKRGGSTKMLEPSAATAYMQAAFQARLAESRTSAMAMRHGLGTIVPQWLLPLFTWSELRMLICGHDEVDIDLLQRMTEYDDDVSPSDPHIQTFWKVLHGFSTKERSAFLRFVWARSRLPATPEDFKQKFKLQAPAGDGPKQNGDNYLPKAHTCFFSLNLPKYSSAEVMRKKLLYAIHHCVEMDADFRLADNEMTGWDAVDDQHNAMAQEKQAAEFL